METLSNEQLRELAEQSTPDQQEAIEGLISQRESLQAEVQSIREQTEARAQKANAKRRTGPPRPRDRHLKAAEAFMQDDQRVSRWREVIDRATDGNGNVSLTPEIIQVAISAYYAQRKRDVDARAAAESPVPDPEPAEAEAEAAQESDDDEEFYE